MAIEDGTFEYKLKYPVTISTTGEATIWETAILQEPAPQHDRQYFKLKQYVTQASYELMEKMVDNIAPSNILVGKASKNFHEIDFSEHEQQIEDTVASLESALQMTTKFELFDFVKTFEEMCLLRADKVLVRCNGKFPMKSGHWYKLKLDDRLLMAIYWCSFFLMRSDTPLPSA